MLNIRPRQTFFTDELIEEDLERIRSKQLDVMIRFGFRILKGDVLNTARFGVWSLHHGDNAVNRGGPPAFWEVVNMEPVTGVTLQQLTSSLDGGIVLGKSFIRTDTTSFNRNQNALFWAGIELMCSHLSGLASTGKLPAQKEDFPSAYSYPLYRNPSNVRSLLIYSSFWWRRFREGFYSILYSKQWSLYCAFRKEGEPERALYRYRQLKPPKGVDWADPFVIKEGNQYYVFFEELVLKTRKAHISCLVFDHQGKLISKRPEVVLKEEFHLSYPFVFRYEDHYYLVPEAASSKSVSLYRCEQFPGTWKKVKEILNAAVYDTTLFLHDGTWYLFGTQKPMEGSSTNQYLYIYYAESPEGEWKPHAQNPLMRDVRGARPAGRIFRQGDKLIRPAQIGAPVYGYGIRFYEIVKLSPTEFEEKPLSEILPFWKKGLRATHTFNSVDGFTVVDAQQ